MESLRLTTTLPATPEDVYASWISGEAHGRMTGSAATSEPRKNGKFTAWDGYISGTHLVLEPGQRIVQAWRTTDFPAGSPDSRLEIRLRPAQRGCRMELLQSDIPDGQGDMYAEGWEQHYFEPMNAHFSALPSPRKKGPVRKAPAKKARGKSRGKVMKKPARRASPKPARKPAKRASGGKSRGRRPSKKKR